MEIFARAAEFVSGQALTRAKSRLALARVRMLRVLKSQIDSYRAEIEKLFAQHPDHDLFGSLPGAGPDRPTTRASRLDRRALKIPPPCSVWREQLPSATSLDRSTRSICGDTAISCSATLCICGQPESAILSLGCCLLPAAPHTRQKPCLRPTLSRLTLAKNPLENVAHPHAL